jgi:hypothetical protein
MNYSDYILLSVGGESYKKQDYFFGKESDTVSTFLPFALRADNTFRPLRDDILSLNPCLFFLFLFDGWYVLFISVLF